MSDINIPDWFAQAVAAVLLTISLGVGGWGLASAAENGNQLAAANAEITHNAALNRELSVAIKELSAEITLLRIELARLQKDQP